MISRRSFVAGVGGAAALAATAVPTPAHARTASRIRWDRLRRHLRGRLVLPSDADYPKAKQLYQVEFDEIHPQAIAYCTCTSDVSLSLRFAQDHDLHLAVRSGGHSHGGYSTTPGLVIDVSRMNSVVPGVNSTSIGTGAQTVDITNALAPAGLAVSTGYCPTVAAGGFLQGGGVGLLTRATGIASDKVKSARVVLADGRTVTASPSQHEDLYWALRGGGGGNFGIVTSYEVTPTPLTHLATTILIWRYDQALDMLDGWTRWLEDAPWTIGSGLNVQLEDSAPGKVPVASVLVGSTDTGPGFTAEVERLISLVGHAPTFRRNEVEPYQKIMMGLFDCDDLTVDECHRSDTFPTGRLPRAAFGFERGRMFGDAMPRDGWAKTLALFDTERRAGQTHQLQVTALGGHANALSRTETAYVHRDTRFMVTLYGWHREGPVSDEDKAVAGRWIDAAFNVIDPYSNGETYQNFIDPRLTDWKRSYYAENYRRLQRVKRHYDPHNVFRSPQSIR
ncbi:FAD-binding oxidoreductase [Actinomadura spongiicola]|uniref:FAD-binding oxidoreductase n=1 Tax=Actinomadura spongiicola TaxID=2303421 RepID=A0A372GMI3_9ACTN|nr:FAD-binding oxidoreductase [Actinomadura spongiicola]RFS86598.1 FAD-binding oxidoreductase [Actinomadura spongiicola]